MWPNLNVRNYVVVVIVPTLALVVIVVTLAMVKGMFDANPSNDAEIFKIIGPAFQTIVGGFMGFLGGFAVAHSMNGKEGD
jgi:hypothetical protein